jgi:hypothetical protein
MRVYDLASLEVFNELTDWVSVRDLDPESDKHYWGNESVRQSFGNVTLEQFNARDMRASTSPAMAEWNREVYQLVQVQGQRVSRRRTLYPTGKPPHVMDFEYSPLHLRVPVGNEGETEVKVLALVHCKRANLDDAQKEANRAAMLFNFTDNAFILLPGASAADDKAAAPATATCASTGRPEPDLAHRPAVFTNLPARRWYATTGGEDQQKEISLARVLDTCSFECAEERHALQEQILSLGLQDKAIDLEADTPANLRVAGSGAEILPNLPLHRKIRFTPVTDPVSGVLSVMVTEHDVTGIRLALEKLRIAREQSCKLLYSMLPEDVADSLCHGTRVEPRVHPLATIFFSDIVGFTSICSRSTPVAVCNMLDELYTGGRAHTRTGMCAR